MRRSLLFLIASLGAAVLMTGCAQQSSVPAPDIDVQSAKKLKMPIVIYQVGVQNDEDGFSRPVVYFVNTSDKPVDLVTFLVEGRTEAGENVTLWADDYEKVSPGKTSQNGVLGGGWSGMKIRCVSIRQAGIHIGGEDRRFTEENINQLFQDPSINTCE